MSKLSIALLAAAASTTGCRIESTLGTGAPVHTAPAPSAANEAPPAAGPASSGNLGTPGPTASADCPNPANHCLPEGDFFVQNKAWESGWMWSEVATQQSPPNASGVGMFMARRTGEQISTEFFYQTFPAAANELAIGQRVMSFHANKDQGIYRAPETRSDATGKRWWTARIVDVSPAETGGYVIVSGGYKIGTDNLRFIEGDNLDTAVVRSQPDAQYLTPEHWMVSMQPLKNKGWQWIEQAVAVKAPSAATKNEGHFIMLRTGAQGWTGHAWKSRPATAADLKEGTRVFMFHANKKNQIYGAPRDQVDGLTKRWWTGIVTDSSSAFKGIVGVSGQYQVAIDAIRVPL